MKHPIKPSFLNFAALILITGLLVSIGCAPAYVPNTVNTPMFSERGDVNINLNTGTSGFDPQFAVAVSDHVGFMVNGSFRNYDSDSTDNFHRHSFVEFGAGYFTKIGDIGRFEAFGGYGYGNLHAYFGNNLFESYARVKQHRGFFQPSIGLASDIIDFSFTPRFVFLQLQQGDMYEVAAFVEPTITLKFGYKHVKAMTQLGFSLPLGSESSPIYYQPFLFSIGLQAKLNWAKFE